MVCVVDISYSDIGMGRAKLRQSSTIGHSSYSWGHNVSRSRKSTPTTWTFHINVSPPKGTLWTCARSLPFPLLQFSTLALRWRFWNGIGLAVLLAQYSQLLNGHAEVERRLHGRFTAIRVPGIQGWRCSRCLQTMTCSTARRLPTLHRMHITSEISTFSIRLAIFPRIPFASRAFS